MVKFKFLAQIQGDHSLHQVLSSLIFFLHKLALVFYSFKSFHISISWWSINRVWVIGSLLKSPGLFSVFWLILTVLTFGWSPLFLLFPILPVPVSILWWLYRAHRLQLVSPSLSYSIAFFISLARSRYLSLFSPPFNLTLFSAGMAKSTIRQILC